MSEDQFTKLFKYMTARFDRLEAELAKKANRKDADHIYSVLDALLKKMRCIDKSASSYCANWSGMSADINKQPLI